MAVELAEKVYPVVRSSRKLIGGAEIDFGTAIFADRLEKTYAQRREGIDWLAFNKSVTPFD